MFDDIQDEIDNFGEKLLRDEHRNFKLHLEFLETLQWTLITTAIAGGIAFFVLQLISARFFFQRRARSARNDIVVKIDEMEGGDAQYLLSFFTSRNYDDATTSITTVHLIGRAFPGRIHDIRQCKMNETFQMFAPFCTEKILVKEDVALDPIIGLTIKTNQYGVHPIWNCRSIIVRNLNSNNSWYFKTKNAEIGFAQAFSVEMPESLISWRFSFLRRVRREIRGGQHVYFGFWAWHGSSAYTPVQRVIVSLVAHSCLISFCIVGLSVIFPPGYESTAGVFRELTPLEEKVADKYGVKQWGWSLEGETYFTIWMYEITLSAIFASFITTFLGLLMVLHFRQQGKYERKSNEMDYCVATALRRLSITKRIEVAKEDWRKENIANASKLTAKDYLQEILQHQKVSITPAASVDVTSTDETGQKYPPRDSIFEPDGDTPQTRRSSQFVDQSRVSEGPGVPLELLANLSPAEARARQRILFIGIDHKRDKRYSKFFELPPLQPQPHQLATNMPNFEHDGSFSTQGFRSKLNSLASSTVPASFRSKRNSKAATSAPEGKQNPQASNPVPESLRKKENSEGSAVIPENFRSKENSEASNMVPEGFRSRDNSDASNAAPEDFRSRETSDTSNAVPENFRNKENSEVSNAVLEGFGNKINSQASTMASSFSLAASSRDTLGSASIASDQSRIDVETMTASRVDNAAKSHPSHHRRRDFYKEAFFRNRIQQKDKPNFHVIVPELKFPAYRVTSDPKSKICQEGVHSLPGEAPRHRRPWYRPLGAWVIALALMVTSIAGTTVMYILDPSNNVHPALFFLLLTTTYVIALTLSYTAFEPVKIVIVACFYAINDRRIHKDVVDKLIVPESIEFQYQQ